MLNEIKNTIKKYRLIEDGDGIVIGLSGGADSVCLTHALWQLKDELGIRLYTAHMNHCLRGDAADRDESFAVEFSDKLGIECITERKNVKAYAKENSISEEMAGRELRYAFFECVRKKFSLNKIATAHNKNDNAETILMNFVRGSTITGLCGIPYKRGNIIRPIAEISRKEIEAYCRENGLEYVTDATNNELIYTRNKIRLELIPKIQNELNSGFINTVTRNAALISEENDYLEQKADEIVNLAKNNFLSIKNLDCHIAIKRRVILKMMKSAGIKNISSDYVEAVIRLVNANKSGSSVNLPGSNIAKIQYNNLFIGCETKKTLPFEYNIPIGTDVYIAELDITVRTEFAEGSGVIKADKNSVITIRNRRDGDFFYPDGMEGKKKLKDYFIDNKIPRDMRDSIGLLTVNNEIACILGKRRDRRFITDGQGIRINILK